MKIAFATIAFFFSLALLKAAEPIEVRNWKSKSGHTVKATALKIESGEVHLRKPSGSLIRVPLHKLIESDQKILREHFKAPDETSTGKSSGAKVAENLPHPLGQVIGPVEASGGSTYYLYLPKSLKHGRDAPLLFYTHSGGGNKTHISTLSEYADLFGWVLAVSVQSKNGAGWDENTRNCTNCLDHILSTLPVDSSRIHYTGNSGGGARAFANTTIKEAYGVMPNIGYIPRQVSEQTTVVYGLGGGSDYNRYLTAYAAEKYKKDGFHRMTKHGHGSAPHDHRGDGMFWMHCKFLGKEKRDHRAEAKDFELSIVNWLNDLKGKNPMRAYSNAIFYKEIYSPEGQNAKALDNLITKLAISPDNVLYHKGLLEIDRLSGKYFAPLGEGGGSKMKHESSKGNRAAEKLMVTFGHIQSLNEVLKAIQKETAG